ISILLATDFSCRGVGRAMRILPALIVSGFCLAALIGCGRSQSPPVGRWEGTYEASDAVVAVRLEISPKGDIFLSAPDVLDVGPVSDADRSAIRQRLTDELAASWSGVQSRPFDFDGRVFRKPGGIAPQLEWDPDTKRMTAVLYFGTRSALHVPLQPVS